MHTYACICLPIRCLQAHFLRTTNPQVGGSTPPGRVFLIPYIFRSSTSATLVLRRMITDEVLWISEKYSKMRSLPRHEWAYSPTGPTGSSSDAPHMQIVSRLDEVKAFRALTHPPPAIIISGHQCRAADSAFDSAASAYWRCRRCVYAWVPPRELSDS